MYKLGDIEDLIEIAESECNNHQNPKIYLKEADDKEKNINLNNDVDDENSVTEKNTNKADNNEKNKNSNNDVTIIAGSTNFFFNFKDTKETIPVLLLFHFHKEEEEKFFGEEVINKLQKIKNQSMIFFDFLYYLDKIYETSKETLIKRNLYNKDLSFIDKKLDNLDVKEKIELENKRLQIISFEFAYNSSEDNKSRVGLGKKKQFLEMLKVKNPKQFNLLKI